MIGTQGKIHQEGNDSFEGKDRDLETKLPAGVEVEFHNPAPMISAHMYIATATKPMGTRSSGKSFRKTMPS